MSLDWIFQHYSEGRSGLVQLITLLADEVPFSLYGAPLIRILAEKCRDQFRKQAIMFGLIPFVIYLLSTTHYFATYLVDRNYRENHSGHGIFCWEFFFRTITIVTLIYFFMWESYQIYRQGRKAALNLWNWVNVCSLLLNTFLLLDLHYLGLLSLRET